MKKVLAFVFAGAVSALAIGCAHKEQPKAETPAAVTQSPDAGAPAPAPAAEPAPPAQPVHHPPPN